MKKIDYIVLQVVLSLILVVMGVLIELNGVNTIDGVSSMVLTVPGITIISSILLNRLKVKKEWYYLVYYMLVYFSLNIVVMIAFKISINFRIISVLLISAILTESICFIFYVIYQNLKHPEKLFHF